MAGTELLTGTQVPLDAAYLLDVLGNLKLGERGQTLGYNESLLNYYARKEEAERQYEIDVQQLGVQAADLRFRERNADATNELQRRSGVVDQESLNYQQRAGLADRKTGIAQMLSERSGPRDGVKYHNLLNMIDPPTAERSTTLDPFKFLEGLVREVDVFNEKLPSVQSGYTPSFSQAGQGARQSLVPSWLLQQPGGIAEMGGGGGGGGMVPQSTLQGAGSNTWSPGAAQPAQNVNLGGDTAFSGVRNEDVANIQRGGGALMTTGAAGPTWGNRFEGWEVSNPATGQVYGADDEIGAGMPVWMQRLFRGGEAREPAMALVGDGSGKRMNEDTELAMALLDEATGEPVLKVLKPSDTKKVVRSGKVRPKRAASGGTYGTGNTDPTMTFNQYSSEDFGNQPFIKKLFAGNGGPSFQGFGAEVSNPSIGVKDAPTLLNLQAFRDLAPTEKDASAELYGTGLEMDWEDLLERSRRAAPWGRRFAPAGYGF